MKREMSYEELAMLGQRFDEEIERRYIVFPHEDARLGAWMNYCEQYEEGNDEPHVELCDGAKEVEVWAFGERVPATCLQAEVDDGKELEAITTEYIETAYYYDFLDNL